MPELVGWESLAPRGAEVSYSGPDSGVAFLVDCPADRLPALEGELADLGSSLVLAGTGPPYRVHVHTDDPLSVVNAARLAGDVSDLQVASFSRFMEGGGGRGEKARRARVLAFCLGDGLAELFERMGASTVPAGPGRQPSTGEIIGAMRASGDEDVFLLPNDSDALQAAEMAARKDGGATRVIPTRSPLQGIAAMEEYLEGEDPERVAARMARAASSVRTGSVARAIRNADLGVVRVTEGQFLGFVDGRPAVSGDGLAEAALGVAAELLVGDGRSLMTVLTGEELSTEDEARARDAIEARFPGLEVEWYRGGQPHYQLLMGVQRDSG